MNVCTLAPMDATWSNEDIYSMMSEDIIDTAKLFDFNAIVGDMDQAGGCEAWIERVMALADDLEVRAAYEAAMFTGLQMRTILKMHRAEAKRLAGIDRTRQAARFAYAAKMKAEAKQLQAEEDDRLLAELES